MTIIKEFKGFMESTSNFITICLALIPSIFLWVLKPDAKINLWWFIVTLYLCFVLLWLLILMFLKFKDNAPDSEISIISFTHDMFLCGSNPFLSHDSIISIYLKSDGFENLIGYGFVLNIQDNGLIQIEPHSIPNTVIPDSTLSFSAYLKANRTNIVIKPIVNKKIISTLNSQGGI